MSTGKKIMLSGVKPTGRPHIGNYFGAMRQFVEMQDEYESLILIADYHALTTVTDPEQLRKDTLDVAIDYLAIGLDPKKVTLFKQSDVPEHTELAWIFNTVTTVPYLQRAHAYKDALANDKEVNVGTFDYPMLMAADILIYDPDVVPVGADQKQHIEIARDTAEKFNRIYGDTFKIPEPLILKDVEIVPGIDGKKMSKSYNNTIPLFADAKEIKRAVMAIVTDSKTESEPKNPEECNVFALHKLFSVDELADIKSRYVNGKIGYKESKELLIKNMDTFLTPMKEKREEIVKNKDDVLAILKNGSSTARGKAKLKMAEVRKKVGVDL